MTVNRSIAWLLFIVGGGLVFDIHVDYGYIQWYPKCIEAVHWFMAVLCLSGGLILYLYGER